MSDYILIAGLAASAGYLGKKALDKRTELKRRGDELAMERNQCSQHFDSQGTCCDESAIDHQGHCCNNVLDDQRKCCTMGYDLDDKKKCCPASLIVKGRCCLNGIDKKNNRCADDKCEVMNTEGYCCSSKKRAADGSCCSETSVGIIKFNKDKPGRTFGGCASENELKAITKVDDVAPQTSNTFDSGFPDCSLYVPLPKRGPVGNEKRFEHKPGSSIWASQTKYSPVTGFEARKCNVIDKIRKSLDENPGTSERDALGSTCFPSNDITTGQKSSLFHFYGRGEDCALYEANSCVLDTAKIKRVDADISWNAACLERPANFLSLVDRSNFNVVTLLEQKGGKLFQSFEASRRNKETGEVMKTYVEANKEFRKTDGHEPGDNRRHVTLLRYEPEKGTSYLKLSMCPYGAERCTTKNQIGSDQPRTKSMDFYEVRNGQSVFVSDLWPAPGVDNCQYAVTNLRVHADNDAVLSGKGSCDDLLVSA